MLLLAVTGTAYGLTLYKCVLRDGSGIVYQEHKPSESECQIEKKYLDPNANVIPASEFIGGQQLGPTSEDASEAQAGGDEAGEESGTAAAQQ